MSQYMDLSLEVLHQKLVDGELTATQLVEELFEHIEEKEEALKAFITLDKEYALQKAKEVDEKGIDSNNILSGIPVAYKDNIVTKDMPTTAASLMLKDFYSVYDATVVEKLDGKDMIPVGKTNMDEFAMGASTETSYYKQTTNAWNHDYVPGGSSGGSAAAVAAGDVPVALGSDTGGSIRQPAAFNGVVGMKPTYGRVSRYGLIAFASSLDQIGPITRNVRDNAHVLNAICGVDEHDYTSASVEVPDFTAKIGESIKGLRIGIPKEYMAEGISEEMNKAIQNAVKVLQEQGAIVEEVSLPHAHYGVAVYYVQASAEAASNLSRFDGIRYGYRAENVKELEDVYVKSRSEGFGDEVKRRIMVGTYSLSADNFDEKYQKASQVRTLICQDFEKVFKDYDLILAPTTPKAAFKFGENTDPVDMYMCDILTIPTNLAGLPGMSIPCGFNHEGLPLGMQLIGRPFDETTMYQVAAAFEDATEFHNQFPTTGGHVSCN